MRVGEDRPQLAPRDASASSPRVFVVIAAYNEDASVGDVVRSVRTRYEHVVVVDDGSTDDTRGKALEAGATVLTHLINRGQGAALKTGLDYATRCDADVVVTFDADGQHDVDDIESLVRPILEDRADVVLGSRFLGSTTGMPATRKLVVKLGILFTWAMSGIRLTDAHNGLRALSRGAAQKIRIVQDRMSHASEIVDEIATLELRYMEVPVRVSYTEYSLKKGQSSGAALRIATDFIIGRRGR